MRRLRDVSPDAVAAIATADPDGAPDAPPVVGVDSLEALVEALDAPRHVWIMVPAAFVGTTVERLAALLSPGDTIIDGGNSHYHDDIRRAGELAAAGITYLDVGTSGGVFGLERGYCLMIGGDRAAVERLTPIFETLAPGAGTADRTPGLTGDTSPQERGWLHCGPAGAGHFVKMVHNGIEYGLMAAYAEGLNVLAPRRRRRRRVARQHDAETDAPEPTRALPLSSSTVGAITELWRRGSVVASSWLLDLTGSWACRRTPQLDVVRRSRVATAARGSMDASQAAIDGGRVPVPTSCRRALFARF